MAPGFFSKLFDTVKKIGSAVLNVVDKAKETGAKLISHAMPALEKVPVIGTVAKTMKPAIDYMANNKGKTMITPPLEWAARRLFQA